MTEAERVIVRAYMRAMAELVEVLGTTRGEAFDVRDYAQRANAADDALRALLAGA